jgi:hypothetical protein
MLDVRTLIKSIATWGLAGLLAGAAMGVSGCTTPDTGEKARVQPASFIEQTRQEEPIQPGY